MNRGLPPERGAGFGSIADQDMDFRRSVDSLVFFFKLAIVETRLSKCQLSEFPHAVSLARGDNIIVRRGLLQHEMHRPDVVLRIQTVFGLLQSDLRTKP